MEAVFEGSLQQLNETDRRVFNRLSVFRGGFTRDAAEAVAGASLSQLRSLIARCLLTFDRQQGRYEIHELLRQFGAKRLAEDIDLENTALDRHSHFYCELITNFT